jgi:hypothetical protein
MRCSDKDSGLENAAPRNSARVLRAGAHKRPEELSGSRDPQQRPGSRGAYSQATRHDDLSRSVVIISRTLPSYDFLVVTERLILFEK